MEEGDLVLCTVERIEQTSVFVKLPSGQEGTLIISEIAPGRIKNLREYVMPNKKIVCKIMRLSGDRIDVSLRRVTSKERNEVMDRYKQEHTAKSAFNQILKEKSKQTEETILQDFPSLYDFILKAKENTNLVEKYIPKEFHEQLLKVLQKKKKGVEVKKVIKIKCLENDGISRIKKILSIPDKTIKITYLAAGTFQIDIKSENYKEANKKMDENLKVFEKLAKQSKCEFEVQEKS